MKSFRFSFLLFMWMTVVGNLHAQDSAHFFESFDNTPIYFESVGNGPVVLLVHGFIVNGESWKKTALYSELISSGYRVITLDMRGNGRSGKPHIAEAYSNDAEARDIMGLLGFLN